MRLLLTNEQSALLEQGTVLGGEWYNLPFWYKKVGENTYEPYMLEDTPKWVRQQVYGPGVLIRDKVKHQVAITHFHSNLEKVGVDGSCFLLSFDKKIDQIPTTLELEDKTSVMIIDSSKYVSEAYQCAILTDDPSTFIEKKDLAPGTIAHYYTYE